MTTTDHRPPTSLRPAALLRMALVFGVLAGLVELACHAWVFWFEDRFVWLSRDVVWMAPLGNALGFCVVALALGAATRFRIGAGDAAAVLAGLLAFATGLLFGSLSPLAVLVLAAGLGVVVGRAARPRAAAVERLSRRAAPWLAGLVVALALGAGAARWWSGSAPAAAPRAGAPNVLLITMDTVRAQSLGLHGYHRPTTPQLERLASRGLVFERAIATSPWTLPTHASLFTGRFHHALSVDWLAPLDASHPTLAEVLSGRGYATAGFVANLNYCAAETGLARGFDHYEDYPVSLGQLVLSTSLGRALTNNATFRGWLGWHENLNRKSAEELNQAFLGWLSGVGDRPFFAFVNYYDAHQPYLPPPPFEGKFGPVIPRTGFRYDTNLIEIDDWKKLSREQVRMEQDSYDAAIAYVDDQIGRLVDALAERGVLDDTLVVITSDHGEQFGEHGLYNHGNSLYLPAIHVPLVILLPGGARAGTAVRAPVSLRDLPATVLDLIGIDGEHRLGGASLACYWEEEAVESDAPRVLLSEVRVLEGGVRGGPMKSLIAGRYHYIRNGDGSPELYDIEYDPWQKRDLVGLPGGREAVERFEQALELVLR